MLYYAETPTTYVKEKHVTGHIAHLVLIVYEIMVHKKMIETSNIDTTHPSVIIR